MFRNLIFRNKFELQREKQKDYRNVVIVQIIVIVLCVTLSEFIINGSHTPAGKLVLTLFSFFGAVYAFVLWDLLRDFSQNRILINTILIVLLTIVVVGTLVEFPYYQILKVPNRQLYLLTIHSLVFPIEVTVIGFAIRDIFSGEFLTPDKLWGSASIFLMTGMCFGSLYDLICIVQPGSLGEVYEAGIPNYSECATYSLSVLGGMDPGHPNASRLIRNISILEAVWANLFVVLIIGKLMGLPRPPKAEANEGSEGNEAE
ncbi:MAG: hypothetical protein ACOYXT_05060 [Bacteroidota bacterium]